MRSVSFLHPGDETMASYRYRAKIPAEQIGASINRVADIQIVSKPHAVEKLKLMKQSGTKIVADFCDDHFDHPQLGRCYLELAALADLCVCPTEAMRDRIPARNIAVIPDPYEMEELEPHAFGDKLLWFGHNAGAKAMEKWLHLKNLTIVTGPKCLPQLVEWSPENLDREMRRANIALFPTVKGHEYKSPNRVINAIRMGLFPLCDKHPAYHEFRRYIWQSDVRTGLKWVGEFRHELNDLVKGAQDYIRVKYSPETIGNQWKDLIESI